MDISTAKGILRCDEDDVLDYIAARELRWAFDLRSLGATKSFVRILARSVEAVQKGDTDLQPATLDAVMKIMFPHGREWMRATELMTEWNTGSDFIHDMIKAGELRIVPGTGDTVNKTPTIYRISAEQLLRTRRMPYL